MLSYGVMLVSAVYCHSILDDELTERGESLVRLTNCRVEFHRHQGHLVVGLQIVDDLQRDLFTTQLL